jgi:hypothetical protein
MMLRAYRLVSVLALAVLALSETQLRADVFEGL